MLTFVSRGAFCDGMQRVNWALLDVLATELQEESERVRSFIHHQEYRIMIYTAQTWRVTELAKLQ